MPAPEPRTRMSNAMGRHVARRILREAEARITASCPWIRLAQEQLDGPATAALTHAAEDAEMLVLGSRGPGVLTGLPPRPLWASSPTLPGPSFSCARGRRPGASVCSVTNGVRLFVLRRAMSSWAPTSATPATRWWHSPSIGRRPADARAPWFGPTDGTCHTCLDPSRPLSRGRRPPTLKAPWAQAGRHPAGGRSALARSPGPA